MSTFQRFKAPTQDGALLAEPGFDELPKLVEENRRILNLDTVRIGSHPLNELRSLARKEVFPDDASRPLIVTGHQPELFHPGVWVKNFAAFALARRIGGIGLNLIVDNDTLKSTSLKLPVFSTDPQAVRIESSAFDRFTKEEPYETRRVNDPELFKSFAEATAPVWINWHHEPILRRVWPGITNSRRETLGEKFTDARIGIEREWGVRNAELRVSELSKLTSFRLFAEHVGRDPRFHRLYNEAVGQFRRDNKIKSRNHPVPDLHPGESPFWIIRGDRRDPARIEDIVPGVSIRPRALTLTLFARLILGDFFIHGIGGGVYDRLSDRIIETCFDIEPPKYQVLSATLHLPFPKFHHMRQSVRDLERTQRDLKWNPQRLMKGLNIDDAKHVEALIQQHPDDHESRLNRFRQLRLLKERLLPWMEELRTVNRFTLELARNEANANDVLTRRDYSWIWYPESQLREYMRKIMSLAEGGSRD